MAVFVSVGFGVEGASLSGDAIHSNKSQSLSATAAPNTGQHTHSALLLSQQVNIDTHTHTRCSHINVIL